MPADEETEQEVEVLSPAQSVESATLALLNRSEIDTQIATAKKYPRKLTSSLNLAMTLATQDPESADDCVYALPRDGKVIEGPSARFAEIIAHSWGNCRAGARVINEDEEFVTAMGSFVDLEQNVSIAYEVRRRITNKKGVRYNSDMISTTANAACSIALRNAVLKGVPKAIWRKVYDAARSVIAGDVKTLDSRRAVAIKRFELMGAKREQIFTLLDVKGSDDITLDHLVTLRGIYNAIREGETTVERAFARPDTGDKNLADKSAKNLEEIKQRYAQQSAEKAPAEAKPQEPAPAAAEPQAQESLAPQAAAPPAEQPEGTPATVPPAPEPSAQETAIPPLDFGDGPKPKKIAKR